MVGHTASSARYDAAGLRTLSLRRAESVAQHLMQAGMNAAGIERRGLGFDKPIADNATPEGRQRNRRIVVVLSPPHP